MKQLLLLPSIALLSSVALAAQETRVNVVIENLAPSNGTFQTPFWVGFHDGGFDSYDGGAMANSLPIQGSLAIESLAEDGNTGPISADFTTLNAGRLQSTMPGPNGPIAPGDKATGTFLLDSNNPMDRYFSYASMVLPSNDAFIANGDPMAHSMFDSMGNFMGADFFVSGPQGVNDAGTEENDELPMNTAFFGQAAPNTGVTTMLPVSTHPGFNAPGSNGILDDPRFRDGQFNISGYPFVRVGFRAAPAVTEFGLFQSRIAGFNSVPDSGSSAFGISSTLLLDEGTRMVLIVQTIGLQDIVATHLHLGAPGQNGPVIANVLPAPSNPMGGSDLFVAELRTGDLQGPLADFPLDELVRRIDSNEVYINMHSTAHPAGEVRGQLLRIR
ncbi:MAG: spondin domain-containing protein [Planctomycetota bacterium]|nr:spondin domain-containing protein [Planctomycetota bacterium]